MISEAISAVLQILVFTLIPFAVYLFKKRSNTGFFHYIGLKKSNRKANLLAVLVCLVIAGPVLVLTILSPDFKGIMTDPSSVTGNIRQLGFSVNAVAIVILAAVFKTSLAEEILFRGFVAKRLIHATSYQTGNILQAVIFGTIHAALFMSVTSNIFFLATIFFFPAMAAYLMVYINEKVADGSIIPGWIAHGLGNLVAYSVVGFLL